MKGSAAYVRGYYGVPAKRRMRILFCGQPATIVGFHGAHLRIRIDGRAGIHTAHPTWEIEYPAEEGRSA